MDGNNSLTVDDKHTVEERLDIEHRFRDIGRTPQHFESINIIDLKDDIRSDRFEIDTNDTFMNDENMIDD